MTMKKLLTIAMILVLVLGMSSVAFADVDVDADHGTVTFTKIYNNPAYKTGVSPAETFKYEIAYVGVTDQGYDYSEAWALANLPTVGTATFEEGAAGVDGKNTQEVTITLPTYDCVGIYEYEITEVVGNTAGVKYNEDPIKLFVTVIEENGVHRVAAVHTEENGEYGSAGKSDEFNNEYCAGTLDITKEVTGNLGDLHKPFEIDVTFTAPQGLVVKAPITYTVAGDKEQKTITADAMADGTETVTIALKHDESATFTNLPTGVTYTVVEHDYTGADGYDAAAYEYVCNYQVNVSAGGAEPQLKAFVQEDPEQAMGCTVTNTEVQPGLTLNLVDTGYDHDVKITNNKGTDVDTGIVLDSLPYVLVLAGAGAVALTMARRKNEEQ